MQVRKFIYKICSVHEWSNFKKKKNFYGTKKDLLDKYIHLSNKNQVKTTLKKHYNKKNNLILLKINTSKLKKLIWEKSVDGIFFPHLYSHLNIKSVKEIYKLHLNKNSKHVFSSRMIL